jgi:hypothetical protein
MQAWAPLARANHRLALGVVAPSGLPPVVGVGPDSTVSLRPRTGVACWGDSIGTVIDTQALAEWLLQNPAAAAMLDVHDPEPFGDDYPLIDVPNAYLAPHLASRTMTAMDNMSWVVKDIAAVLGGRAPRFPAW